MEKRTRGITLIALVITIIVLLILAAVSIATLTGENGILTRASTSEEETRGATVEELKDLWKNTQLAESYNSGSNIQQDLGELLEDLKNQSLITEAEKKEIEETGKITIGKRTIEFVKSEPFANLTIGTEQEAKNTDKYGWKVKKYNVEYECIDVYATSGKSSTWRLFFQDNQYAYLIAEDLVGEYKPSDYYNQDKYKNGSLVSILGRKLSGMIKELFIESNASANMKMLAWITDTSNDGEWAKYKNNDAVFAIGSPTIELFAASYNYRSNKTDSLIVTPKGEGYDLDINKNVTLSEAMNNAIYNYDDNLDWWIASPSDTDLECLIVDGELQRFYRNKPVISHCVRPIVGIPTKIFDDKYATEDSLVDEGYQ